MCECKCIKVWRMCIGVLTDACAHQGLRGEDQKTCHQIQQCAERDMDRRAATLAIRAAGFICTRAYMCVCVCVCAHVYTHTYTYSNNACKYELQVLYICMHACVCCCCCCCLRASVLVRARVVCAFWVSLHPGHHPPPLPQSLHLRTPKLNSLNPVLPKPLTPKTLNSKTGTWSDHRHPAGHPTQKTARLTRRVAAGPIAGKGQTTAGAGLIVGQVQTTVFSMALMSLVIRSCSVRAYILVCVCVYECMHVCIHVCLYSCM